MKIDSDILPSLVFNIDDIAISLGITKASARVLCSRYTQKGKIFRIRKNLYILRERWRYLSLADHLLIANRIQVPSYISFSSAIQYYEMSDQMYRNVYESIARKRSVEYSVETIKYNFHTIECGFYQGFTKHNGIFIAEPEKALVDIIYFSSIGRYSFDFTALNWNRIDRNKLDYWLKIFPEKTFLWWERNGYFS